ncbi:PPE domain-containing protein [Nocardia crassostreae]|uniref:PPE domain-containing protein n=1 Tax=Nocardia crassostreae TaxID=53428 RepID=UPI000834D651|nr:PPE domain-containing protein [Nocardia crassostreae]
MTLGITGVFWLPRMAELNSVTLNAGAHAILIAAASTSWGVLTGAWVEATATVARVMAEVGVGLQGVNGLNVLARLGGFTVWAEQQGVMAAVMAAKTAANATAYTVASIAMPSLPEIALVEAARVAAHSTGGALNGTAGAAEAAKLALDIRAALVMETYEAATTALITTPGQFLMPPPIAMGAGSADAGAAANMAGDPVQAALATAAGLANNPAVISTVAQAAQVAGTVVTSGVSTAGQVAGTAVTAVANGLTQTAAAEAQLPMMAGMGVAAAGAGAAGASTRAVSFGGGANVSIGNGGGTLKLPEGWGAGAGIGAGAAPAAPIVAEPVAAAPNTAATIPVRSASTSPLLGSNPIADEDETHDGKDYGRSVEHFADGRVIAPAVIGGDPADAP